MYGLSFDPTSFIHLSAAFRTPTGRGQFRHPTAGCLLNPVSPGWIDRSRGLEFGEDLTRLRDESVEDRLPVLGRGSLDCAGDQYLERGSPVGRVESAADEMVEDQFIGLVADRVVPEVQVRYSRSNSTEIRSPVSVVRVSSPSMRLPPGFSARSHRLILARVRDR